MNPKWPGERSRQDSVWSRKLIREALDRIAFDLSRDENSATWSLLRAAAPSRSAIELRDMVWWSYFRRVEPVPGKSATLT